MPQRRPSRGRKALLRAVCISPLMVLVGATGLWVEEPRSLKTETGGEDSETHPRSGTLPPQPKESLQRSLGSIWVSASVLDTGLPVLILHAILASFSHCHTSKCPARAGQAEHGEQWWSLCILASLKTITNMRLVPPGGFPRGQWHCGVDARLLSSPCL